MTINKIIYNLSSEDYSIIFQKFLREVFSEKIAEKLIAEYVYKELTNTKADSPKDKAIRTLFEEFLSKKYKTVDESINIFINDFINKYRKEIIFAYTCFNNYVYTKDDVEKDRSLFVREPSLERMKTADYFIVNRTKTNIRYETKQSLDCPNEELVSYIKDIINNFCDDGDTEYLKGIFKSDEIVVELKKLKNKYDELNANFIKKIIFTN